MQDSKMTYRELTQGFAELRNRIDTMNSMLTGVVAILGPDEVIQAATDWAEKQADDIEAALKAQIEAGVRDGWLKPVPVSGLKTLVIGVETSPASPRSNRMQLVPNGIRPRDRGQYIGRAIGEEFTVASPHGPVLTKVTEIYEVDEARRAEVAAQAKATAAAEGQSILGA